MNKTRAYHVCGRLGRHDCAGVSASSASRPCRWNAVITMLGAALTLALSVGCAGTPSRRVTHEMTLQQAAVVPPPAGLTSIGPIAPAGSLSLSGGVSAGFGDELSSRDAGHLTLDTVLHGRFAGTVSDAVELGVAAEFANAEWGARRTASIGLGETTSTTFWRVTPGVRGVFFDNGMTQLGMGFEFGIGRLPFRRQLHYEVTVTDFENGQPTNTRTIVDRTRAQDAVAYYPYARLNFFGTVPVTGPVFGAFGVQFQNEPVFTNNAVQRVVCTEYEGFVYNPELDCPGLGDFGEFEVYHTAFVTALSVGAGASIGPVTLLAQLHGHLSPEEAIAANTPFGADLELRVTF